MTSSNWAAISRWWTGSAKAASVPVPRPAVRSRIDLPYFERGWLVKELLEIGLVLVGYLVVTQWLLPKLGVPT